MVFLPGYLSSLKLYFKNHFKYMVPVSLLSHQYYVSTQHLYCFLPVRTHHNSYRPAFSNFFGESKEIHNGHQFEHCQQVLKGALSGLRQFLAIERPLKMIQSASYFTSKALFVLKIFKFLSGFFGHVAKRLDQKNYVNFKFYDFTARIPSKCNTHIVQYLKK